MSGDRLRWLALAYAVAVVVVTAAILVWLAFPGPEKLYRG